MLVVSLGKNLEALEIVEYLKWEVEILQVFRLLKIWKSDQWVGKLFNLSKDERS